MRRGLVLFRSLFDQPTGPSPVQDPNGQGTADREQGDHEQPPEYWPATHRCRVFTRALAHTPGHEPINTIVA